MLLGLVETLIFAHFTKIALVYSKMLAKSKILGPECTYLYSVCIIVERNADGT